MSACLTRTNLSSLDGCGSSWQRNETAYGRAGELAVSKTEKPYVNVGTIGHIDHAAGASAVERLVMCVGTSSALGFKLAMHALKDAGVPVIVVPGSEPPPEVAEILMPFKALELPKFDVAIEPKDKRQYWRRFEKRRNT